MRWPTRRGTLRAALPDSASRVKQEDQDRKQVLESLARTLVRLELPAVARAQASLVPAAALRRCGRGLRVATLRMRLRNWRRLEQYLAATHGVP